MTVKTISEIAREIRQCESLQEIEELGKYVDSNKYKYPLIQLYYLKKCFNRKITEMAKRDANDMKRFLGL